MVKTLATQNQNLTTSLEKATSRLKDARAEVKSLKRKLAAAEAKLTKGVSNIQCADQLKAHLNKYEYLPKEAEGKSETEHIRSLIAEILLRRCPGIIRRLLGEEGRRSETLENNK